MNVIIAPGGSRRGVEARGFPFAPSPSTSVFAEASYVGSVPLVGGISYSYARIYRSQPWVYAVVNKIMRGVGQLPLKVFRMVDGERERIRPGTPEDPGLAALLDRPTPHDTPTTFKQGVSGSLEVYGNYLGVKMAPTTPVRGRRGDLPSELWSVPWWRVRVTEGTTRPIDFFTVVADSGRRFPFTPDEVVYLRTWAPDSVLGISPMEPLRRTLAIEDASLRETQMSFENANRPGGVFVKSGRPFTSEQAEAVRAELHSMYGGVDNAYKVAVLNGELDWKAMSMSHQEQELIPVRKLAREEVAACYGIDPTQVGILDRATFANVTEAHRGFYMDTLGPRLVAIEEGFEAQLVAPEPEWAGLDLEFDLSEVLKGDVVARADAYMKMIQVGFTPDEIRHLENAPPLGTALSSSGFVQKNLQPLDGSVMPDPTPPTPDLNNP